MHVGRMGRGYCGRTFKNFWNCLRTPKSRDANSFEQQRASRPGTVFARTWPSTGARHLLTYASDLVSTIRDFRNRLFHHELAWKRFGVLTEADALQHLLASAFLFAPLWKRPFNSLMVQRSGRTIMSCRIASPEGNHPPRTKPMALDV
jgi:hypothetical protein